jgi:A/G-specific adenine glycosylase
MADGGSATTAADLATVAALLPANAARAARASIAFMELGALICTARQPACPNCPLRRDCAWHARPDTTPGIDADQRPRRPAQRYHGTDRQARGALLALCRANPDGVPAHVLDGAWADAEQRDRALSGLLHDGLIVAIPGQRYGLPGLCDG